MGVREGVHRPHPQHGSALEPLLHQPGVVPHEPDPRPRELHLPAGDEGHPGRHHEAHARAAHGRGGGAHAETGAHRLHGGLRDQLAHVARWHVVQHVAHGIRVETHDRDGHGSEHSGLRVPAAPHEQHEQGLLQPVAVRAGVLGLHGEAHGTPGGQQQVQQLVQREQLLVGRPVGRRDLHTLPRGEVQLPQLRQGVLGHWPGAVGRAAQLGVVVQHQVAVTCQVDVALHAVRAVGDRLDVGRPGQLRIAVRGSAVRVDQRTGGRTFGRGSHGPTVGSRGDGRPSTN